MPMGRPGKLTPDVQERICEAIQAGNYYRAACASAGIGRSTFLRWMRHGRKAKQGKFRDFWCAVKKAEADAEVTVVAQWRQQIPANWQAARDFLARRFPKRWMPKQAKELKHGSDKDNPIIVKDDADQRSEFFRALGERLAPFPDAKEAVRNLLRERLAMRNGDGNGESNGQPVGG